MTEPKAKNFEEALELGGDDLIAYIRWEREQKEKKKLLEDYGYLLKYSLEEFKKRTECPPYLYYPTQGKDTDEARLSFIKYMTEEKHFRYAKGD